MSNWTTSDIPDQSGRTAVITGANTGSQQRHWRSGSALAGLAPACSISELRGGLGRGSESGLASIVERRTTDGDWHAACADRGAAGEAGERGRGSRSIRSTDRPTRRRPCRARRGDNRSFPNREQPIAPSVDPQKTLMAWPEESTSSSGLASPCVPWPCCSFEIYRPACFAWQWSDRDPL